MLACSRCHAEIAATYRQHSTGRSSAPAESDGFLTSHSCPTERRNRAIESLDVDGLPAAVRRRAGVTAITCAGLLAAVYLLAVWTPLGQRFEDAVLRAADGPQHVVHVLAGRIIRYWAEGDKDATRCLHLAAVFQRAYCFRKV